MVVQPVGPLPGSTYWRRRLVVLALLLVLVLLLLAAGRLLTGSSGGAGPQPLTTRSPAPTTRPTRPAGTPGPTRPAATAVPKPAVALCRDGALSLSASTDLASYPVGSSPRLGLTLRNTGPVACRRDLGADAVELLVLSGADRIWSSIDCSPGTGTDVLPLAPGAGRSIVLSWSGRRSRPGCTGAREQALPGTYRLVARVGSLRSAEAAFSFR